MGCVQSSNVPVTQSNDRKKFVEHLKQSSINGKGKVGLQNHKVPEQLQQYDYSKHGLERSEQLRDSRVSIFSQQRKKLQQRSNRRQYMEIHPDEMQKLDEIDYLVRLNEKRKSINPNHFGHIFPVSQQLILSSILPANNNNHMNNALINNNNQRQQLDSQLLSNFQQDFAVNGKGKYKQQMELLKSSREWGNNNSLMVNINSSDTERELIELHGELTTMIVLWESVMGGGKRLKVQRMNTQRNNKQEKQFYKQEKQKTDKQNTQRTKRQQHKITNQQFTKRTTKQQSNNDNKNNLQQPIKQIDQPLAISPDKVVDMELEDIWNENVNQLLAEKQYLNEQYDLNDEGIERGKKFSQAKDKATDNNDQLQNPRIHIHDYLPITANHQQPIKLNLQTILSNNNLSSFKNFTQKQSQPSSHDQYSKCLLSNPTRILNDSLVDQKNEQKEVFYFGGQCYPKWVETDRKAYEVKSQDILVLLMRGKQLINQEQMNYRTALLPLLCVIKDHKEINRVNLIAFKTITSTSILLQPSYISKLPKKSGFKIFYNGTKRLFPFEQGFDGTDLFTQLERMFAKLYYCQQAKLKSSSQLLYNLTGWIPETIMANEITSYQGVLERLNNNFIDGNTIITFTGSNRQVWGLKSISLQKRQIQLYHNNTTANIHKAQQQHNKQQTLQYNTHHQSHQQFSQTFQWSQFICMVKQINVNWNPLIYEYVWRTQNVFCSNEIVQGWRGKYSIGEFDQRYMQSVSHQYLLKIPPSEEDIEVRVFLEVHYCNGVKDEYQKKGQMDNFIKQEQQNYQDILAIQLHDYTGTRVNSTRSAIRIVQKHRKVFSDVLIFQSSQQKTQYVLVVRPEVNNRQLSKTYRRQIKYTISALTFAQVSVQQIPVTRVKQQKIISTYLQQSHCGYGINSPHFLNSFYLQLKIPPLQKVKIFVTMPVNECAFELNLIANPDGEENLTRLNLDSILGDIVTSEEFHQGKGYLEVDTKYEEYFFMITNHTLCKGEFKIIIQVLENVPKYLTPSRLQSMNQRFMKSDQLQPLQIIQSKQKFFYQQPIFTKEFKWIPTHTGPRKRLKSNTHSGYQMFAVFREFFKNPYIDYKVDKLKRLQFSVHSKTFMEEFDAIQESELRNDAQPPTISLVILRIKRPNDNASSNNKCIPIESSFKIILDDAFYVPFGFGFWTKPMELEQGEYRFVFPKMEKSSGVGVFRVYLMEKE